MMTESTMIKVSIIMPVYNAQEYLASTLETVFTQTLEPLEIICVDDGSTDSSLEILKDFALKYDNIVVLTQKNQGAGKARNYGLSVAKGDYVAFLDADDCYPAVFTLEILYQKAVGYKAYIAGGSFSDFAGNIKNDMYGGIASGYTFKNEGFVKYKNYQFDYGYHRFIYQREFLKEHNIMFPNYRRFQDPPFFIEAMVAAKKFYAVPMVTYCYRVAHKEINWSDQKVNDFFEGLLHDLQLAKRYDLRKLYWITLKRFQGEARDIIYSACHQNNAKMRELLHKFEQILTKDELPVLEKLFLYHDMKRFIRYALNYCEIRSEHVAISKYMNMKRALNGSYFVLYGFRATLKKYFQRMKLNREGI